jgi:hypothetical protein
MKILLKQKEKKPTVVNGTETIRLKFAKARKFLNPVNYIIQMGFMPRPGKSKKTALGRAMSALLKSAMVGTYPAIEVDPALARLSAGIKFTPKDTTVVRNGAEILLTWNPTPDRVTHSEADDRIILCAYAVEQELAAMNEEEVYREQGRMRLELPEGMEQLPVHLYLIVHDRDKKNFSNSYYLGFFN